MSKALQVNLAPTADIHPAPWNVRTGHDVAGIAESIRVNGFRDPIEVWRKTGENVQLAELGSLEGTGFDELGPIDADSSGTIDEALPALAIVKCPRCGHEWSP